MEKLLPCRADYRSHVFRAVVDKRAILNMYTGIDYRFLERFHENKPKLTFQKQARKFQS